MAVKFTAVKCPECGANLPFEEGREVMFCSYCGAKIIMTNENEHVYRHVDEVGVKHAETAQMVEIKKMELAEKKREAEEKNKATKIKISLGVGALMILFFVLSVWNPKFKFVGLVCAVVLIMIWKHKKSLELLDLEYKIPVPSAMNGYETKSYTVVEAILRSAGFDNITLIPLGDLKMGVLKKPDTVESVIIDGNIINHGGRKFPPDAPVVISYHSFYGEDNPKEI